MEQHNVQRLHGSPQREESESPQLPPQFMPTYYTQNIQPLDLSTHHQHRGQPATEQAMNPRIPPQQSIPVSSEQNIQPLDLSTHHRLQGQPATEQAMQHEQNIHANTRARPDSETPSRNIQQTNQSQGFRECTAKNRFMPEPHQYHSQQILMPRVQQGSDVMAENVQQPHLTSPPTHQATNQRLVSVQQRQTFESPEHLQMPFQYIEQPVSHQQSQFSLQRVTKKRKLQHSYDETNVSPDVFDSGQTSMRNVGHTSGRAPQSEYSAHHEGVASSSTDRRRGDKRDRRHRDRVHRSRSQERREKEGWHGNKGTLVKRSEERTEVEKEEVEDVDILVVNASGNEVVSSAADSSEAESGGEEHASHSESEADDAEASGNESSAEESESGDDESGSVSDSESGSEEESSSGSSSSSQSDSDSDRDESNQDKDRRDVGEQHTITDTWEHRENLQRHNDFLKLLLRIAGDLGKDELKSLKFLCRNGKWEILKGEIEDIHDARDLFQKLLDRKLISADDSKVLVDLLQQIGRVDLVQKISPIQPHNITECIKWLQKYLKEKYKRHYKAFKPIPWNTAVSLSLTEIYTRLKVMKADKGLRFKKGQILENELEIFQNTDAELPCRRIAIKGAPAMGKSTFCRKLAYDWACGNSEEKLPQFHFELLFFLEMRHVSDNKRLDDIIFHQLLPEDANITKEILYNYIQQNQNSVLCLFDGLDELASISEQKSDILAIISEKLLTWCTVVTTTRPNMLHSSLDNCHAHFRIEGFTQTDAVKFISKYFTHVGNQQEAEKLISELKLENVKPLQSYPYKVDYEYDSTESDSESDSGDSDDKSLHSVDNTTDSHIRYDLLCNPLHLTFVCLLWEERKIIPKSNMTDIYTDILECVLKRYCCKNDKTLVNDKVPQDVNDEVNRLAHCAYDVCSKGNMMLDEDGLSETILNLGLLVKDSGISRVKVQRHCFFYHKTWLEYFTALHNVHCIVHSIGIQLVNQKQVCLFVAGILKKKADPFLKQLVKKMQDNYDTWDYNITAEFSLICECLHEASIDIDLAPEMPNQLILLGKENVSWYTYYILQREVENIYGLLNCDTVFVFEQLRNMLCQKKGSVTNIKHLLITDESHDKMSELARQVTKMFLSLTSFEIQEVSIAYMQLLTEALRKGWQLNTLILSPAMIDPELKEQASQTVIDLFKSVNCNKYLENFSWGASPFTEENHLQDLILCPLNELVEDGPNDVTLFMYYISSENNAIEIESLSDSICKFTTKCKNTKKLIVHCNCCVQYTHSLIVTKLIQALKSASQVLTSYGILCENLFKTPDTTQNLVEALNMNSNISDFEARVDEDQVSNVIHFIGEVKHVKSLTLHTYFPDNFKSLMTNIELKRVLKHLTIEVFFSQDYILNEVLGVHCGGHGDQYEQFLNCWDSDHHYIEDIISNYLISPLNILLSKAKTSSLHSLTVTTLLEDKGINIGKIASMLSSHVESKDIVMDQFVSHLAVDLKAAPFEFTDMVNGVTITIDITSANDK